MTDAPYTPSAPKVFRSAWMPAPPPESDPAMVTAIAVMTASALPARHRPLHAVPALPWPGPAQATKLK